jgi:hypothetical protein
MTCGSHLSARGRGSWVPLRGRGVAGPGLVSGAGPKCFPGVRFYFYFFFPLFPFLFSLLLHTLFKFDSN